VLESLNKLFQEVIKDLYSAERQLVQALPKMAKAANSPELKEAFQGHLEQTKDHVERLEELAKALGFKPTGKMCRGMEGLIDEGKEVIEEDGEDAVIDAALICAAQKVEHYEISGYGSARAIAEQLGLNDAVQLLQTTLDEEGETDKKLTGLSEGGILELAAAEQGGEAAEEQEDEARPQGKSNKGKGVRGR
jgi:ferritin-like metal-binding protein YciE